jgi:hypothetical protein
LKRIILSTITAVAVFASSHGDHHDFKNSQLSKALNPDISLIMDSSVVSRSISNHTKESLEIPGFTHSEAEHDDHGHSHSGNNDKKGFNLNYAELGISSEVDPYFDMNAIFHIGEDSFETEELYINAKNLPVGIKVGKFLSSFGRLNEKHHHYWNFADQPLVYSAFLGDHGLNEKGVALNYILPTDTYLNLGFEILNGDNENSFGTTGFEHNGSNAEVDIDDGDYPNLIVTYLKSSHELSDKITLLGGLSIANGKAIINHEIDETDGHAFVGDSQVIGLDFSVKYDINSYSHLLFEGEYITRELDGKKYENNGNSVNLKKEQAGYYASLHYKIDQLWGAGVRYEALNKNLVNGVDQSKPDDLSKYSLMAEYTPSEFSKIRLQYNKDESKYIDGDAANYHEVILQLNLTIGAHGAHKF